MTGKEASGLIEIISRIIEGRRGEARISPSWVATEGMQELRAGWMREPNNGYPLVYIGCHLQLRQIARGVLRERFEPELDDGETVQHPLFPGLQWRYPIPHAEGEEPQYVLLDLLTDEQIDYNIERIRSEVEAKQRHIDILVAYKRTRPPHSPAPQPQQPAFTE
jgi:hypothetical protein